MKAEMWRLTLAILAMATPMLVMCAEPSQYGYAYGNPLAVRGMPYLSNMTQFAPKYEHFDGSFTYDVPGYITRLSGGWNSATVVINDTKIVTWGRCGQTGRGNASDLACPPSVVLDTYPAKVADLTSGDVSTILLLDNGTVLTWGTTEGSFVDHAYELILIGRDGVERSKYVPGEIDTSEMDLILEAGEKVVKTGTYDATLMLTSKGRLFSFGWNRSYGLGQTNAIFTNASSAIAREVDLSNLPFGRRVIDIDVSRMTLLLLDDGSYMCYGPSKAICGGRKMLDEGEEDSPLVVAQHFVPPVGVRFKRLLSALNTLIGFDEFGHVWSWGEDRYVPNRLGDTCNTTTHWCTFQRWESIPNAGKVVDLFHVDGASLFAVSERNTLYELRCPLPFIGTCEENRTWKQIELENLPDGYMPDISRAQVSGLMYFGTARRIPPCTPSMPPFDSEDFVCSNGVWTLFSPSTTPDPSRAIIVDGHISIRGNLTLPPSTTVVIQPDWSAGTAAISIEGCLVLQSTLDLTLDLTHATLDSPKSKGNIVLNDGKATVGLFEFDSSCGPISTDSIALSIIKPKSAPSCKRFKAKSVTASQQNARTTMNALFEVDTSRCSLWWIILVSVLGGVIIIALVIGLIVMRMKAAQRKATVPLHTG